MTDSTFPPTLARITGIAAILAPLILLLSSVAYLTAGGGAVNDGVLGGTIGVWSVIALAIASVGVCRLAEPRAPRAAPIINAIALAGFTAGAGWNVQAIYIERYDVDFVNDPDLGGSDLIGILAFLPWGWMAPLGFILMGWLLWRTGSVPTWTAGLLALGGVLFVAGRPAQIDVIVIATDVVLTVALVPIGMRILSQSPAQPTSTPSPVVRKETRR
jgi:hypothetical protein